jgi:hypothetical protein
MTAPHGHPPEYRVHGHSTEHGPRFVGTIVTVGALALVAAVGVAGHAVYQRMNAPHSASWDPSGESPADPPTGQIDPQNHDKHRELAKSSDSQLRKLSQYEKQYGYGFAGNILRTGMPHTLEDATKQGDAMAKRLKEYKKQGIQPTVLFEPSHNTASGNQLDLKTLNNKKNTEQYQAVMDTYFAEIQNAGVTDKDMGVWVPFPTPDVAAGKKGGVTDPELFKQNAVPVMQAIKTHFREALVAVTFDPQHDGAAYVDGIPDGLVDIVGIQSFPESPYDHPSDYLSAQSAMAAASKAGAREIWFNTGSAAEYRQPNGSMLSASTADRADQLKGVFDEMGEASKKGFGVYVNIVVEDDSKRGGSNWGYSNPADISLMKTALADAQQVHYPVMFYDGIGAK